MDTFEKNSKHSLMIALCISLKRLYKGFADYLLSTIRQIGRENWKFQQV